MVFNFVERENIVTADTENAFKKRLIELLENRFDAKYPFKSGFYRRNSLIEW